MAAKGKKATGRPSSYTQKLADTICERLLEGESLRNICKSEDMPAASTVFKWLNTIPDFAEQYARAKEEQAEILADEIVQIADEEADPAKARVRVDARKWVASKLKPKKYGDKLDIDQKTTHEVGDSLATLMAKIDGRSRTK